MKKRYGEDNLHVVIFNNKGLIYDVPSNTLFKVSEENANKICQIQSKCYESLVPAMKSRVCGKVTTVPSHDCWWKEKRMSKLTINVTSECNLRCKYCYADYGVFSGYYSSSIAPDTMKKYINNIINTGVRCIDTVQFFGGEPLLAIDTIEVVCEYFKKLYSTGMIEHVPVYTMITNGILYNEKIFSVIRENNIRLTVSIDGPREIHDYQRIFPDGKGTYDLLVKNMEIYKSQIDALEATYTIKHVENEITVRELRKQLSEKFCLPQSRILIIPVAGSEELNVQESNFENYVKDDTFTVENMFVAAASHHEWQSDLFCNAGYSSACIMPNGDLYPCHMYATNRNYCLGNIGDGLDLQKLEDKLNKLPLGVKLDRDDCKSCWARKICHICPAKICISEITEEELVCGKSCKERREKLEKWLIEFCYFGEANM